MDLKDRALLLNPDEVAALLEGLELEHAEHGIGRMQDCDRAVCRLAAEAVFFSEAEVETRELKAAEDGESVGRDQGYDEGYDDGYADHAAEVKRNAAHT